MVDQTLPGVKKIELIQLFRTRWELYLIFAGVISTTASILRSVLYPIFSRLSDLLGRNEIYSFSFVFHVISYVILATAQNFDAILGGRVVSTVGEVGLTIMGLSLVGDVTNKSNRGFIHGLYQIPLLINYFVSPLVAEELAEKRNEWRWAFGHLPLVLLVCELPFLIVAWKVQLRVQKSQTWIDYKQERHTIENQQQKNDGLYKTLKKYLEAIDIVGSVLMAGALTMTLLPFILATAWGGWKTAKTLGTFLGGAVTWMLLTIWEWKFATQPLVPAHHWSSATPIYGAIGAAWISLVSSINWMHFHPFLQVTRKATITRSTYIRNGYRAAYTFVQPFVGLLMMKTKKWRPYLWIGMSLFILGVGLMIIARQPHQSDGFVVVTQIISGAGAGIMDNVIITAIQSAVPHNDLAMVTALFSFTGSIGGSIGSTIAGAIWNGILPGELVANVPGEFSVEKAAGNYLYTWKLPDEQYDGVVTAYGNAQKLISIISICLTVVAIGFLALMRDFGLNEDNDQEQQKQEMTEETTNDNDKVKEKTIDVMVINNVNYQQS
ncbi:major facilitator superfamily domain-containing protein [Phascolomyces articulosus]|uniref:Major facilitator superfamily domain-containing protein n=1 Tax=Phascolomyces articulosus TaxID=60185 RepID=A0AAD5JMJ0_9FUNG|nr:major facilitator superfamily domain-containing protein [Phascolomyces articulosus]